jgi:hypothetical protein
MRETDMNISAEAIHALIEKRCRGDVDWCSSYGEPGYSDSERGIIFANWNKVSQSVQDWLEHHDYSIEWSDEWIIDHETSKAYRTSPTSYGWRPSYVLTEDCEIIGRDEVESGDQIDAYIDYLLNDAHRADTFDIDWTKHGFRKLNREAYESGFHPGQTDDPRKILRAAQEQFPNDDFLFSIDETGQFDMRFSLWARANN